ncbi:uncharacterized protein M6B38_343250 [Iris pallida]|nr:uncharacterized protein M6B38_343250 [Iris pallida]
MAMSGISTGATVLLCMDELWILFQIFEGMFSVALSTCNNFDSVSAGYSQDFVRKLMTSARKIAERNIVESEYTNETMIITSTQIFLDATLQFEPMDAIFNDSRGNCSRGTPMKSNGASSSGTPYFNVSPEHNKSSIHELLDLPSFGIGVFIRKSCVNISWQGTNLDLLSDFSGFESVIFSHQNLSGVCTDISQIKSMLKESSEQCICSYYPTANLACILIPMVLLYLLQVSGMQKMFLILPSSDIHLQMPMIQIPSLAPLIINLKLAISLREQLLWMLQVAAFLLTCNLVRYLCHHMV